MKPLWNIVLSTVGLCLMGITQAAQPMVVLERSFESTTFSVTLPSTVPARLTVRPCDACNAETVQLATTTRFYIGKEEVPYSDFANFAQSQPRGLMIRFTPETRVATRLAISE